MQPSKLFVYGILKRGYELDLKDYGATFLGEAFINGATLYGIGRLWNHEGHPHNGREFSGVGLKIDGDYEGVAYGELWEIPNDLWNWLDKIEQNGYCYTRKVVPVHVREAKYGYDLTMDAWVYVYTHPAFNFENPIKGGVF